jgi:hypothetical protein
MAAVSQGLIQEGRLIKAVAELSAECFAVHVMRPDFSGLPVSVSRSA